MLTTILIFIGAGLGGVLRYWITHFSYLLLGRHFPYGTLIVNVSGCFLMGLLFIFLIERGLHSEPQLRALILIGFLGGFTTFSSFSIETLTLLESGTLTAALANIFLNVALCLAGTALGIFCARQF